MVKKYKESFYFDAIQFLNTAENTQQIIDFAGLPVSVDYKLEGVRLRVIKNAYDVAVARVSDYLVKNEEGRLFVLSKEEFESRFEEVTEL